jgi:hypothetical protein
VRSPPCRGRFGQQNTENKSLHRIHVSSCRVKSLKVLAEFGPAKRTLGAGFDQAAQENYGDSGGQTDSIVERTLHVYR